MSVRDRVIALVLVCCLFLASEATAATYYVASAGNDANPGTQGQPFRTIAKGLTVLTAGDTLYLRGGTYAEHIDSNRQAIPSGTSWSNAITVAAYPGETVTLRPSGVGNVLNVAGWGATVYQYLIFDGLIFDGAATFNGISMGGPNVHHIKVSNGEVKNVFSGDPVAPGGQGIAGFARDSELIKMKVHNNGKNRYDHGMYFCNPNVVIRDSEFYNNSGYGIQVYGGYPDNLNCADNVQIYNNRIYGNRGDGAVTLNYGDNILFYNNLVYNNPTHGVHISYGQPNNVQVYNNTFYKNRYAPVGVYSGVTNTQIRNNIFSQNGSAVVNQGTGTVMSHNLTTDPQFVNAAANDFHLQATSPAIDAGIALSAVLADFAGLSRPQGAGYDIGAYEYPVTPAGIPSPQNVHVVTSPVVAGTIRLAFAYAVVDEARIDRFVLQRKFGEAAYADHATTAPALRDIADSTAAHGVVYCYRMLAEQGTNRSAPSNEVCGAWMVSVVNLRVR